VLAMIRKMAETPVAPRKGAILRRTTD